jgi:hypothetical protein
MSHAKGIVTGLPVQHAGLLDAAYDALSELQKLDIDEREHPTTTGDESLNGLATKPEAIDAGIKAGIISPGVVTLNNRFFFTDPAASIPIGTWATEYEAERFAIGAGRADLIPVYDSPTGRFRLEEPPQSGIVSADFNAKLGQFVVEFEDGGTQLVKPPPASVADKEFGSAPIPGTDFMLVNDGQGGVSIVQKSVVEKADFELGTIKKKGRFQFIETSPGNFQRLPDKPEKQTPGAVEVIDGREFIRDSEGNLSPLAPERILSLDERISEALGAGNVDLALGFADFRDRPNSMEAFQAAMDFATSPGDVAAISAIARGHRLVSPPPAGEIQRIAAPPEFLESAFARLQRDISGGRATPNDFMSVITQAAASEEEQRKAAEQADIKVSLFERIKTTQEAETDALDQRNLARAKELKESDAVFKAKLREEADARAAKEIQDEKERKDAEWQMYKDARDKARRDVRLRKIAIQDEKDLRDIDPGLFEQTREPATFESQVTASPSPAEEMSAVERGIFQQTREPAPTEVPDLSKFRSGGEGLAGTDPEFFAHGGTIDDGTAIVGEEGPELLIAPIGSKVIPLDGDEDELARLKKRMGIKGLEHGGTVESLLPIGVRQALRGGIIEPTRRRLSTAAGLPVLSAQAQQNLLPEELDVLDRLRAEAGIPLGAFQQEQASALPGAVRTRPSRFAARIAR